MMKNELMDTYYFISTTQIKFRTNILNTFKIIAKGLELTINKKVFETAKRP